MPLICRVPQMEETLEVWALFTFLTTECESAQVSKEFSNVSLSYKSKWKGQPKEIGMFGKSVLVSTSGTIYYVTYSL